MKQKQTTTEAWIELGESLKALGEALKAKPALLIALIVLWPCIRLIVEVVR